LLNTIFAIFFVSNLRTVFIGFVIPYFIKC